ncbi:hypothetical protein ACIBSW_04045 [Actinoplanes sp. NPDC049668]|uniref:hypothetical protein n=1 Tax=unclassified Actinoplanes TaxID=2626549 RepID=UPI0033A13B6A
MMIRRHGTRPTIALWMLVAIADIALLVAAVGSLVVLLAVVAAVLLGAGVVGAWMLQRRTAPRRAADLRRRA